MVTRITKTSKTSKPVVVTPVADAIPRTPEQQVVHSDATVFERAYAKMQEGLHETLDAIKAPGWVRSILSFIASFCVGAAIGWIFGLALDLVVVGALTLTGSASFAFIVWVLGILIAVALATRFAPAIGMAIYTGDADRWVVAKYHGAKNFVAGVFTRKERDYV